MLRWRVAVSHMIIMTSDLARDLKLIRSECLFRPAIAILGFLFVILAKEELLKAN